MCDSPRANGTPAGRRDESVGTAELVRLLQRDLPVVGRPFAELGRRVGLPEEDVLSLVRQWMADGKIRRLGAVLSHRLAGKTVNVMVVWKCPEDRIEEVGRRLASLPFISHCYERETQPGWDYNLYAMMHANDASDCDTILEEAVRLAGLPDHALLFTDREFKKTSWEIAGEP